MTKSAAISNRSRALIASLALTGPRDRSTTTSWQGLVDCEQAFAARRHPPDPAPTLLDPRHVEVDVGLTNCQRICGVARRRRLPPTRRVSEHDDVPSVGRHFEVDRSVLAGVRPADDEVVLGRARPTTTPEEPACGSLGTVDKDLRADSRIDHRRPGPVHKPDAEQDRTGGACARRNRNVRWRGPWRC